MQPFGNPAPGVLVWGALLDEQLYGFQFVRFCKREAAHKKAKQEGLAALQQQFHLPTLSGYSTQC